MFLFIIYCWHASNVGLFALSRLCEMQYPYDKTMRDNIASMLTLYLDSQEVNPTDVPATPTKSNKVYGQNLVLPASKKQKRSHSNEDGPIVASPKTVEVVDTWTLATGKILVSIFFFFLYLYWLLIHSTIYCFEFVKLSLTG